MFLLSASIIICEVVIPLARIISIHYTVLPMEAKRPKLESVVYMILHRCQDHMSFFQRAVCKYLVRFCFVALLIQIDKSRNVLISVVISTQ